MIRLLLFVRLVVVELPVIVQTVPCVRFTVLLPEFVEITPRRVDACALNVVVPLVVSSVLLFAIAVVLARLMLAVVPPSTEKEAALAEIVPLMYCSVLGGPPLLN